MHIGFVIYGSLDTRSGGYLYDRQLVSYLRRQGDRVTIFSMPWRTYAHHLLHNLQHRWLEAWEQAHLDVLIQDELNHPSLFHLNRRFASQTSIPILALVHHLRSDEAHARGVMPIYRWVERSYLQSVHGWICNSRSTLASVQALTGQHLPAVVAHPGRQAQPPTISHDIILARSHASGPLRLLFVGNIIPRKGLHILLQALSHLPATAAHLTIVGDDQVDPSYSRRLRQQMHPLGLVDRIQWLGAVSDERLRMLYAEHQVLVVPSQHEGFGIVYLEAMAYGVLPIGTESGGAREIIRPGETGLLIPPNEPQALAARLLWLHHHRDSLAQMAIAARRAWLAHPTWEQTSQRIRQFIQTMIER